MGSILCLILSCILLLKTSFIIVSVNLSLSGFIKGRNLKILTQNQQTRTQANTKCCPSCERQKGGWEGTPSDQACLKFVVSSDYLFTVQFQQPFSRDPCRCIENWCIMWVLHDIPILKQLWHSRNLLKMVLFE